jgi:hypothetical protein
MCDNREMLARGLRAGRRAGSVVAAGSVLVAALALGGCATQHQTAQALTIAGAAAVIVGASLAADSNCYDTGEGPVEAYCTGRASKSARNVGKGVAVAGVGLAAAGYALTPRGPDRMRRVRSDPPQAPSSPYRLIRRDDTPEEPTAEESLDGVAPGPLQPALGPAPAAEPDPPTVCRPEGSSAEPCPPEKAPPRG